MEYDLKTIIVNYHQFHELFFYTKIRSYRATKIIKNNRREFGTMLRYAKH